MVKTSTLLSKLFQHADPSSALVALQNDKQFSKTDRRNLCSLTSISPSWSTCDQTMVENKNDLCQMLLEELYIPYKFYSTSLKSHPPRDSFDNKKATLPLKKTKCGFWSATDKTKTCSWLPSPTNTFDCVVHFIQSTSGTGVILSSSKILTCAHVIDNNDDDDDVIPNRLGRKKIVMLANSRIFESGCINVEESLDGTKDVAMLELGDEIILSSQMPSEEITYAELAIVPPTSGDQIFTVGNPSNIDLESTRVSRSGTPNSIEFDPPIFHLSLGTCENYTSKKVYDLRIGVASRGRAPTRGETKGILESESTEEESGVIMEHTCWTYWGHSGAPLFNVDGEVVGLHSSWCSKSGIRMAVKLRVLRECFEEGGGKKKKVKKGKKVTKRKRKEEEIIDLTSP
ncbi:hypothetical protein TL16_g06113 [Triparma laevis f. inornata]|uniref:Uncharacterized protein n=1 Tax=Triparma laevis f. inornata TaxID=1714386 RepID=A0A9W7EC10_9STRA|nr:hypothetical protein TL16_g06113 [Triparma laevis f. inornata]